MTWKVRRKYPKNDLISHAAPRTLFSSNIEINVIINQSKCFKRNIMDAMKKYGLKQFPNTYFLIDGL